MKTFEYVAWDYSGNCQEGVRQAASQEELLSFLRSQELTPAVITEVVGSVQEKTAPVRYKKVKSVELATFCWQLSTMLSGGLSITSAIQTIADEISNPYFEDVLKSIGEKIEKGMSLTDCVKQYPKVFSKLCCAIIMAGETGDRWRLPSNVLPSTMKTRTNWPARSKELWHIRLLSSDLLS